MVIEVNTNIVHLYKFVIYYTVAEDAQFLLFRYCASYVYVTQIHSLNVLIFA